MISINEVSYSYHRSEEEQIKRISMETTKEKLSCYVEEVAVGKQP